jgi:hypothetical protein
MRSTSHTGSTGDVFDGSGGTINATDGDISTVSDANNTINMAGDGTVMASNQTVNFSADPAAGLATAGILIGNSNTVSAQSGLTVNITGEQQT